jgi:H+-transporting ATPase
MDRNIQSDEKLPKSEPLEGLRSVEVEERRKTSGFNEIEEQEESLLRRFIRRLWGPIPWMIEIAAVLSAAVQKWEDLTIILVLLVVNVFIDFHQESKALSALKAIKSKLAKRALVKRDRQWQEIDARELVPGDLIRLRFGNLVPADAELVDDSILEIDQSALTGESLPVQKVSGELVYSNSIVRKGETEAFVRAIGSKTYFGKTASLVVEAGRVERSHFQKAIIKIGNLLIGLAGVMVSIIVMVSLFRDDPMLEIVRFSMVLAIASIPVALPAVLSVTMAVGALHLAKHRAVVSRLVSIEELAGVDMLCCDKTGTLTKNEMTLGEIVCFGDMSEQDALVYAALASRREDNDPLEIPIFNAITKRGLNAQVGHYGIDSFTPFNPVSKYTQARVHLESGESIELIKGAPQAVLAMCNEPDAAARQIEQSVDEAAEEGFRTLGVATRQESEQGYQFVALVPMFDPPRDDSKSTITEIKKLGVDLKMITGDNLAIAKQIAGMVGLRDDIDRAQDFVDGMGGADGDELLERSAGVAEVFPEHKFDIVSRLQRRGHIVGMTGDGVNDAPALRKADAGIAVSGATDAARAAADLVLLAPGLAVIAEAIREARQIFGRMMSYSIFRLAETMRVIFFMTLAIVVFNFYPVTPIMIIILALLNDIPIMAIAYDNARVEPKPVRWNMREVITVGGVLGVVGVISSFLLFFVLQEMGFEHAIIQSIIFLKLDVAGHSTIYVCRTREKHFWHRPYPSLKFFLPAFSTRIIGTLVVLFGVFMEPIGWKTILYVWLYATAWFVFNDFVKVWTYRFIGRNANKA